MTEEQGQNPKFRIPMLNPTGKRVGVSPAGQQLIFLETVL